MCIKTRIEKILAEREALDARIAKLELLVEKTAPIKNLLAELLEDYTAEAPEDLVKVWGEILVIGSKFNLSVQPLTADELKAWEAANAKLKQQLEEAQTKITEQDRAWGKISDERDDLEGEVSELRSQIEQLKNDSDKWRAAATISNLAVKSLIEKQENAETPATWEAEDIAPGLEKLYQEALTENTDVAAESIPALTLWQPWATLIEQEVKRIETRSWSTNYRGPIAIHAAKKTIAISAYPHLFEFLPDDCEFPLGVVVAIANLVDCVEMTPEFIAQQSEQELKCGDWQPGRFAWVLEIIRSVVPPIPATGGQKLWSWSGTSVAAELEYLEKLKTAPEPEETTGTVDGILESKGFFEPDNFLEAYSSDEKHETYRGWDIYYSLPNGGVVSIGLDNSEYKQVWDASTEYIQEIDATFPESLADYDEIVAWTRALIDRIENLEVPGQLALELEFSEPESEIVLTGAEYDAAVEEKLALDDEDETIAITFQGQQWLVEVLNEFASGISILLQTKSRDEGFTATVTRNDVEKNEFSLAKCAEQVLSERVTAQKQLDTDKTQISNQITSESIAKEVETDIDRYRNFNQIFELQDFKVDVRQHNQGENFAGASFGFYQDDKLIFSKSLVASECSDKPPKELATEIIEVYWQKLQEKKEMEVNPYKKSEDDFIELIRLNPSVGYLRQKAGADAGKIMATYIAFANRDAAGNKTETLAKSRAKKWYEYLQSPAFERCNWKVEEVRKVKRMASQPGDRQQFAYEIKITGKMSIEKIQKLAENDFSLLPEEIGISRPAPSPLAPKPAANRVYQVKIDSFQAATGNEQEMRSRFEEELKNLGGSQMSVSLLLGPEVIESYRVADFQFVRISDFDEDNPEFEVTHLPSQKSFKVYRRLNSPPELNGWTNSIYPYSPGFTKREAAAADAVRRLLKAESAE